MENRYCKNYMFKEYVQRCLTFHLFTTFQSSAFSSGCQSRFFLDMPENLQWNSCSHGWLRESHPTASSFAAGEVPDSLAWEHSTLGKSKNLQSLEWVKFSQQSLSHVLEMCFLTTLQHTFADFTDTSLDILFPLSQPEPELACTVSCSTCSFILRLCASSSLAELIMDCISSSDDMAARTRHEHLDSTFALLLIRNGKLCNHMRALAWHDTVRLGSKPFIVAMCYSDTVWYGEAMQLLTFLRCIQRTATKLGNQPASETVKEKVAPNEIALIGLTEQVLTCSMLTSKRLGIRKKTYHWGFDTFSKPGLSTKINVSEHPFKSKARTRAAARNAEKHHKLP